MTSHDDVPYADPQSLSVLIEECRCLEGECAAHGVVLHPVHHRSSAPSPAPIVIGEAIRHVMDGFPDYGG